LEQQNLLWLLKWLTRKLPPDSSFRVALSECLRELSSEISITNF
jgi:hypothetical protein